MQDRSLLDHLFDDVLANVSGLKARPMFGGFGLYLDGMLFGLFDDGVMYLKVDEAILPEFLERGCKPFSYPGKDGNPIYSKGSYSLPEELLDDAPELERWIRRSADITKRKKKA